VAGRAVSIRGAAAPKIKYPPPGSRPYILALIAWLIRLTSAGFGATTATSALPCAQTRE
jgi:hypothetical protein